MNDPVMRHPGAETMAAFLEGKLAPREVADVAEHLRECEDCRTVTGEAARFEQWSAEERAPHPNPLPTPTVPHPRGERGLGQETAGERGPSHDHAGRGAALRRKWWLAPAAAAAAAIAFIAMRPTPIERLIDASPREYRRVEGRLSGFPWARLQGGPRSSASRSPAELALNSAAYAVLDRTAGDDAVDARHAAGVAHLLIDQTSASLEKLAAAAGDSNGARVWNDLAAARFTVAVREGRADPLALAAVNRAIELDSTLAEAYFNRALILEHLNLHDQARAAWKRYLELDPSSEWSNEARLHLAALDEPSADIDIDIRSELARAARNREAVASLVRRFPQDSRTTGEGMLLGEWVDADLANDAARAEEKLALMRAVGEELAANNGERMLLDTVESIDSMRERRAFAAAVRTYIAARREFGKRSDLDAADDGFQRAVVALRALRSPFAQVAEYYAAQCAFDNNRPAESTAMLLALRARLGSSHRALSAEVELSLARNANAAADWGTAAHFASRASATFTALGETGFAATAVAAEAIALEGMGAVDLAWQRRMQAVGVLRDTHRIATILQSGAIALAAADDPETAAAVLDVAKEYASNPETHVAILTDRARFAERAGDVVTARRLLGEARTELANLSPRIRETREAQIDLTDAVLRRASDPYGAIAALEKSIAFYEQTQHGIRMPDAYQQRARAYRAIGRTDEALADYDAALRKIQEQQAKVSADSRSIEFLDVAAQTIDETIDLHLERGEVAKAFAVADRAHAMETREYRMAGVMNDVAVIEYAVLPKSVVIFCVRRNGISAERVSIDRATLAARVTSFVQKVQRREDAGKDAASLYAVLIAPVASKIATARELVIVPDRQLNMLPFAALHDGSKYLIEKFTMRIAPSAAASPTANRQAFDSAQGGPPAIATVIAEPASSALPLPWSREEAKSVAAIHGATVIEGRAATRARVSEAIASSAIVHYAGHADSGAASYGALLLASDGHDSGLLTASDIARLELRARPLVVLSACGTLRGETTHIAGTPSLARAFLHAGASAVVATLWEIDDDIPSHLFLHFHQRVRAGEVPAGALRTAQLAMLQSSDPRLRHPSSWSAVEVLSNL